MKNFQINIKKTALKFIKNLKKDEIVKINSRIQELKNNPYPFDSKKLIALGNLYRIRVGNYRIIYEVNLNEIIITIIKIAHRKDVYK